MDERPCHPFLLANRVLARRMPQLSPSQRHAALLLRFTGWAETTTLAGRRCVARGQGNLACARKQQSVSHLSAWKTRETKRTVSDTVFFAQLLLTLITIQPSYAGRGCGCK